MLGPLAANADGWSKAPAGRWCPGEIVSHLNTAMKRSADGFEARADHAPMKRRPQPLKVTIARMVVLGIGWLPTGRRAPDGTGPESNPDQAATEAELRRNVERFLELERKLLPKRENDLYVKHPVLGDLTLREFMRFHVVHAEHHAKQIRERIGG